LLSVKILSGKGGKNWFGIFMLRKGPAGPYLQETREGPACTPVILTELLRELVELYLDLNSAK